METFIDDYQNDLYTYPHLSSVSISLVNIRAPPVILAQSLTPSV
jgi:hypothetical protein